MKDEKEETLYDVLLENDPDKINDFLMRNGKKKSYCPVRIIKDNEKQNEQLINELKNAIIVDLSVNIWKFSIDACILSNLIPSVSTNIKIIIITAGTNANKYNQNKYGLAILSR